ncbi:ABC transporter permease [Tropicimonas sp. IMCC34043]|uniref:ABC transporter permease n=1 Tax=Tropicimonas sp. IMCC34043 TaxID=2248760 RepID=UPI000E267287|nr:ABC transporter permease [Tropicimonas sp. IMCC34043]
MTDIPLTAADRRSARSELGRRRMTAFLFVAPLLLFLLFTFAAPIGTMLVRGFYHPTVSTLIPDSLKALKAWDRTGLPPAETQAIFAADLKRLADERLSGKMAEELNRVVPGSSSLVKSTARKIARAEDSEIAASGAALLAAADEKWTDPEVWRGIITSGNTFTADYFLTAMDLERSPAGGIMPRDGARIYVDLFIKTLKMALIITIATLILGYPLAHYLATAPAKTANLLMVFVLLPFWTSLLVRTTAWIALLQTNGVVNSFLMGAGITRSPFEMLYTEFSTIVAMTHILLPFMILPLYSVMKGIDPSYMRAALSMGARPLPAFFRVYLPMTLPGLSAGALLVFIISVGYYITPALVGGTKGQMISNIIAFHMQQSNNWELAAALGTMLLVVILLLYWVYDRFVGAGNIKFG